MQTKISPHAVALTAAAMMDGASSAIHEILGGEVKGTHAMGSFLGDHWQHGGIEFYSTLADFALASEESLLKLAPEDFPGVYEYEVSDEFGRWFALAVMAGDEPSNEAALAKLYEMQAEFFAQGGR